MSNYYYLKNKDTILAKNKTRYEKNRERYLEINKLYRDNNKAKISKAKKKYRLSNIDKIKAQHSKKIECECGSVVSNCHVARHLKTKKHIKFIGN